MSTYFVKTNKANSAIVVANKKMETVERTINGQKVVTRKQVGNLTFGFVAIKNPAALGLTVGQEVPFVITDSPVFDQEGTAIPNLFWAE
jgi:hypothetical protein